jgi:hypothetical protein
MLVVDPHRNCCKISAFTEVRFAIRAFNRGDFRRVSLNARIPIWLALFFREIAKLSRALHL